MSNRFDFMVKFKEKGSNWQDIGESAVRILLKDNFSDEEIDTQILKIKFGHKCEIKGATIDAWPHNEVN